MFESEEQYMAALEADPALLEEGERAVLSLEHTVKNIGLANDFGRSLDEIEKHFGASPFSSRDVDSDDMA